MKTFRTRQAPSPTGYLHLGTARTMLFTKLFALINNGVYFLRLEDTDRNRLQKDAAVNLIQNLNIIGLQPDEGVNLDQRGEIDEFYGVYQIGKYGPYIQSERVKIYQKHAQELIDKRLAYWAYLTPEDKQELQELKQATKKPINYFKIVSQKINEKDLYASVQVGLHDGRKPALMYKLQRQETLDAIDELLGKTTFDLSLEEDFVILKSDGFPTYHFAHVIDDHLMETSLVVRAQEWFASLPKHIIMFREIWGKEPKYLHLPFILGETGNKKMSKRDGNVNMQDYLDRGYLPEAIINYLAFLGWNPGSEKELFLEADDFNELTQNERLEKLISNIAAEFSIDKLSKSPARFNLEKLNWFNREYIKMMSLEEFCHIGLNFTPNKPEEEIDTEKFLKNLDQDVVLENTTEESSEPTPQQYLAWNLDKNRITVLSEFGLESDCVLNWKQPAQEAVSWKKITTEQSLDNLKEIFDWMQQDETLKNLVCSNTIEEFSTRSILLEQHIKSWLTINQKDTGSYLWPLRVVLSGKQKSPSPFELLAILNWDQIVERVESVLLRN